MSRESWNKGKKTGSLSVEHRRKISQSLMGNQRAIGSHRKFTEETKKKMSIAKLGNHFGNPANRKGKSNSKEHNENIQKAQYKIVFSGKHNLWKGDNVGYRGIHHWLNNKFGKAKKCENKNCKFKIIKRYEWSLLKNKKYQRKRANFWQLCAGCHRNYDMGKII